MDNYSEKSTGSKTLGISEMENSMATKYLTRAASQRLQTEREVVRRTLSLQSKKRKVYMAYREKDS